MYALTISVRDRETGYVMDYNYECHFADRVIEIIQGTAANCGDRFSIVGVNTHA